MFLDSLHLLIQVLPLLLMLKVWDKLLDGFNHLGFGEVGVSEEGFQLGKEAVHLVHVMPCGLLHYTKSHEPLHVNLLAWHVELLVGLLACSVRAEVNHWISRAIIAHIRCVRDRFRIISALLLLKSFGLYKLISDGREGEHLVFA